MVKKKRPLYGSWLILVLFLFSFGWFFINKFYDQQVISQQATYLEKKAELFLALSNDDLNAIASLATSETLGEEERITGTQRYFFTLDGEHELAREAVGDLFVHVPVLRTDTAGLEKHLDHHQVATARADLAADLARLDGLHLDSGIGEKYVAHRTSKLNFDFVVCPL